MKPTYLILLLTTLTAFYFCGSPESGTAEEASTAKAPPANETSDNKTDGEWVSLFDGETLNGWHLFNQPVESGYAGWAVEDGTIALTPQKGNHADLVTNKAYDNYEMELEWKISDCGNSGIIYNVQEGEYKAVWHTGPEMQVLDNKCHPDAKIETHRAGDLYDMIKCNEETVMAANEWNKVKLVITDTKGEHWLNGKKVVEFDMHDDSWSKMIADSKFKNMPDFGKFKGGHIALQDHSDKVWYRNIRIREL
ncbi:MAG: DUF1080 domain-containing protein [Bacteroidota bacterium]